LNRAALTRREFLAASASLLVGPRAGGIAIGGGADAGAPAAAGAVQGGRSYAYVGTYTPNGGGIYLFEVDAASGAMTQLQVVDDLRNPSWLALSPDNARLFAISEIDNYQGSHNGAVAAYAIDPRSLRLTRINVVSSSGNTPSHVSVHPSGNFLFVSNYGAGSVAVLPVGANGMLGEATDVRPSVGPRHRARAVDDQPGQFAVSDHDGPHIHMAAADPLGQFVIANDAGLDLTLVWRFDSPAGRLLPADAPAILAPAGSAPRHFVFHPNGRIFYNLYEQDAKIAVYDYDPSRGALRQKQIISTLPAKFAGSNLASEIVIGADGAFLYSANRLHNAISAFAVQGDGQLKFIGETWVHADSPRSLGLDPTGETLYACNQKGDSITSFRITAATGALQFTGRFEPVGSPAVMTFVRPKRS